MLFCVHCGTKLPDSAKFCLSCGKAVLSSEESGETPPAGLGPEEQRRIYEEEKARIEARERIEEERRDAELRLVQERREAAEQERAYIADRNRERKVRRRWRIVGLVAVFISGVVFMGLIDKGEIRIDLGWISSGNSVEAGTVMIESRILDAIAKSDDLDTQKDAFVAASVSLVEEGSCSLEDLDYNGGWVRTEGFNGRDVYYTYCGPDASTPSGARRENRIYLDVTTGEVFR